MAGADGYQGDAGHVPPQAGAPPDKNQNARSAAISVGLQKSFGTASGRPFLQYLAVSAFAGNQPCTGID